MACPGCERQFNKNADSLELLKKEIIQQTGTKFKNWEVDDEYSVAKHIDTKHMTFAQVKEWFNKDSLPNLREVNFSGAIEDPATNPELYEMCKYFANEMNCKVAINTNGSLKTETFWSKLGELGIIVEFALDGLEDTLHIYRVGASYKKVIANAKAFIAAGGNAIWKFIDFKHNCHQKDEAIELAREMGFKTFIHVKSSRPASYDMNTETVFEMSDSGKVECQSIADPWLYVNYDGVMSPCCYLGYNERSKNPKDNLHNSTVKEYFDSSKFLDDLITNWETEDCNRRCYIKCKLKRADKREVIRF